MASLKTQFSELRRNTPKHVQWLLLAAAFIVVLILLTLLLRGGGDKKQNVKPADAVAAVISIDPSELDWTETNVGDIRNQRFVVSSNVPVKIDAVRAPEKAVPGLGKIKTTCINIVQISDKTSCTISVEYAPTAPSGVTAASLFVDFRGASQPENMKRTEKITIAVGAKEKEIVQPKSEPKPEPVVAPKPTIREEIEAIAPSVPFVIEPVKPVVEKTAPVITSNTNTESCSDFAFAGFGISGQQIGWIKPTGGAYMFHPFADKNCNNPTGTYNPDTGIITDINNPGRKIGTDAEHVGYASITNGTIPQLSNPVVPKNVNKARQLSSTELATATYGGAKRVFSAPAPEKSLLPSSMGSQATVNSQPYDRTFVLRQYKPIPATIVSEIRAVAGETRLPVTATVDRNVYSDDGRTIIVPAGTMMLGSVVGDMPGPYKAIGRISIEWYRFVRPDGVEFNFQGNRPFSGDAQGRTGVPGRGSTDYMEQFVMPMLTAIVPAAVNMIAPISDKFINQIDLDNNTVTQSGQVRSSELAKNEIISAWNTVAQKLLVDMMDNTVPPFSIASGTRITVFSPTDLVLTCGAPGSDSKKCAIIEYNQFYAPTEERNVTVGQSAENAGSLVGQVRSFNLDPYCDGKGGVSATAQTIAAAGYDYRTVVFYCQAAQYQAINNAKQQAVYQNQQDTGYASQGMVNTPGTSVNNGIKGNQKYNQEVLGLEYKEDGTIQNPFQKLPVETPPVLTCEDGTPPDGNGCCTDETYTDMGEQGFNCCPAGGGDCFPPII